MQDMGKTLYTNFPGKRLGLDLQMFIGHKLGPLMVILVFEINIEHAHGHSMQRDVGKSSVCGLHLCARRVQLQSTIARGWLEWSRTELVRSVNGHCSFDFLIIRGVETI